MNDKRRDGLTEFDVFGGLDPAVDSLIERGVRRQAEAHLPGRERKKKARERAKAKARLPRRVNWDLPIWIKGAHGRDRSPAQGACQPGGSPVPQAQPDRLPT
jgi:hypothetical protein